MRVPDERAPGRLRSVAMGNDGALPRTPPGPAWALDPFRRMMLDMKTYNFPQMLEDTAKLVACDFRPGVLWTPNRMQSIRESPRINPGESARVFPWIFLGFLGPEVFTCVLFSVTAENSLFPQFKHRRQNGSREELPGAGAVSRRRLWRMQAGEGPMRHRAQAPALAPVPARQCRIVEDAPWRGTNRR